MNKFLLTILITVLITGCIPDEDPVQAYDRGDMLESEAPMGALYAEQIYFSLGNNAIVAQNTITDWDLGFACADGSYEIILNFGKFMQAAYIDSIDIDDVTDEMIDELPDEAWLRDNSEGKTDSTAIGRWFYEENSEIIPLNRVYIIDRGLNEKAKSQGTVKFRIVKFENNTYTIEYADISDHIVYSVDITKDASYNYIQLLFESGGQVISLEPVNTGWDILFSKYTQLLYTSEGEELWYSVTGAYLNPNAVETALIETEDFASVSVGAVDTLEFSSDRNIIGHDWKSYDMDAGSYTVYPELVYIIKGVSGFYYKFHFLDFYDNSGNKGCPKFEYQKL